MHEASHSNKRSQGDDRMKKATTQILLACSMLGAAVLGSIPNTAFGQYYDYFRVGTRNFQCLERNRCQEVVNGIVQVGQIQFSELGDAPILI